jgi:hypothetical protein
VNKIRIGSFDFIKCDNGMKYEIIPDYYGNYDYFLIEYRNDAHKCVNEVNDNYLNEAYEDGQPICVGEDDKRNPIYAKITDVYNLRGINKSR